jgi:hypothetical protein
LIKRLIIAVVLVLAAWQGYEQYKLRRFEKEAKIGTADSIQLAEMSSARPEPNQSVSYKCDGRIYCFEMTSCAEAKFFLKNCPGVKMDGDNDGIPCERQWCH